MFGVSWSIATAQTYEFVAVNENGTVSIHRTIMPVYPTRGVVKPIEGKLMSTESSQSALYIEESPI